MHDFLAVIPHLFPLYALIGLGYIAGRWLDVELASISRITMFVILPLVVFGSILHVEFNPAYLLLPVAASCISLAATFIGFGIARIFLKDGSAYLVGAAGCNGNALYFGLPLILHFFGAGGAGIYLLMNLGPQINNITLAYFLTTRGRHTLRESLRKVARFPAVHAGWLGITLNLCGLRLPEIGVQYWEYMSGALVVLGMMMIGIGISKLEKLSVDWPLTAGFFGVKFGLWPLFATGFVLLDMHVLRLFGADIHRMLLLFSVMPVMGNLVAYAAESNLHPERTAMAVLLSTVFTVVMVPLILMWAHFLMPAG